VVEAALVLVVAALITARRPLWETAAFGWWAVCGLVLAFTDLAVHRLPDRVTYPAAVGTIGLLGVAALVEDRGHAWLRAVIAGMVSALVFAALTVLLGRRGPGLGDAKLMLSCVAVLGWLGWPVVVVGILACFTAQALWGVGLLAVRRADRSTFLPLGPFLVGATLASIAWLGP
jgi:leader peptidase (prepilin peptidase)/N-methyltransferase